ncbi:sorbosone dehydrogenase family protein [Oceanidesulfovibrio marinus]|uniref:Sorbosone dehydrogenase family protein n=1 Tax=Oceanidesulfovibrio marinus TaxID=370038 RepID=A0ABX6NDK2_9BACT|nr:sorbosone dehydrogenase family protein [Oceanidesulfovibrio marinus]
MRCGGMALCGRVSRVTLHATCGASVPGFGLGPGQLPDIFPLSFLIPGTARRYCCKMGTQRPTPGRLQWRGTVKRFIALGIICMGIILAVSCGDSQTYAWDCPQDTGMEAFVPSPRQPTAERIQQLRLPDGFRIDIFARDLGHARMMAVDSDGAVYLTTPDQNRVLVLRDTNGDGAADDVRPLFRNLPRVHGITIHEDRMYLASPTTVWLARRQGDTFADPKVIIDDLPRGGRHPNRTLGVGPDGKLYISVGSSCNACEEQNSEHATVLRAELDGSDRAIFTEGLRNTIGFDWHPDTQKLWGMDHGSDGRGDNIPPEELNLLAQGNHYGWPWVYGKNQPDPVWEREQPETVSRFLDETTPATLTYQAHSSPLGFVFYNGDMFPEKYRTGAFVPFRGSWNRCPPTGYKVAFVQFDSNGQPTGFEDFVTGFLMDDGRTQFARLAGIAVAKDGALLVADDSNGVVYRISYQGK